MVSFESLGTVSCLRSIATIARAGLCALLDRAEPITI